MSRPSQRKLTIAVVEDISIETPLEPSVNLMYTHISAFSALLYIVVMGMVSSYSAPATSDMKKAGSRFRGVTSDQITWIASLPNISGMVGNAISGYISHKLGRKAVLMLVSISFVGSWLLIAYAPSLTWIYAGRLISGFCAGICAVAVPAYVVEISTPEIRGRLTAGFQVSFATGVFIMMSLGIGLRWSWIAISGAITVTCAAFLMLLMPESPPWLVRASRSAEAVRGLIFLRGKYSSFSKELKDIEDNLAEQPNSGMSFKDFLDPALYKPLAISISLMFFQQFSGINALMAYFVDVFATMGSSIDPRTASAVVAAVQVVSTFTSSLLMDKAGRRLLYITSGTFMFISLVILGLYSILSKSYGLDVKVFGWIPLVSFMIYIGSFSLGFGPIPFVMTPELVPIRSRSTVLSIANVSCSFFGFVVTKLYEDMRTTLHDYGLYWTYAFFTLCGCVFCCLCLPETKGRTLHDIHKSFSVPKGRS